MTLQFKIQIHGIQKPPVWRRIIVPAQITFDHFHGIIQAAFGWENCHLYRFSQLAWRSEPIYKIPDEWDYYEVVDSRDVKLSDVFEHPKQKFTYLYDFGDDWIHDITLEEITGEGEAVLTPICTAGKGACPPEDCGGPWGYLSLLDILSDSKHPQHREMRRWLGLKKNEQWDVNAFDIAAVSERLKTIRLEAKKMV